MENPNKNKCLGVLLAGGLSRRMGGGDKALKDLVGQTMLGHVAKRLEPQVAKLIINANGAPDRFAAFALPIAPDTLVDNPGPLAGVLAGMRWAATHDTTLRDIITAPADTPFLPADLAARLMAARCSAAGIVIARSQAGTHPVVGLWPVALADNLEAAITGGVRKVMAWCDQHDTTFADFDDVTVGSVKLDPFFNANTPDDFATAERLIASSTAGEQI